MEEAAVAEVKPNVKKAFLLNIIIVCAVVLFIILFLFYLHSAVDLRIFIDAFKEIGIVISPSNFFAYLAFLILVSASLLLILNYVVLGKSHFTLYPDKIVHNTGLFIIQFGDEEIPYSNIAKLSYEKKPFLNTAKIILELTGMKKNRAVFDFIDDAEEVVGKMQGLIREYKARYYAQYTQQYRMQDIMGRL